MLLVTSGSGPLAAVYSTGNSLGWTGWLLQSIHVHSNAPPVHQHQGKADDLAGEYLASTGKPHQWVKCRFGVVSASTATSEVTLTTFEPLRLTRRR